MRIVFVPTIIPSWATAQVWGGTILWKQGVPLDRVTLAHELEHVHQWKRHGAGFAFKYLEAHVVDGGWANNRWEKAAMMAESDPAMLKQAEVLMKIAERELELGNASG